MIKRTCAALAVGMTLALLHGCGNQDANQGDVRIVNATTDYATLDLYTQDSNGTNNLVVGGTAAGAVSSYTGLDKAAYTFNIKSGTGAGVAATTTGTVNKSNHYTLVAYLTGNALATTYLTDEEAAPSSGNAKLRIFNAASNEAGSLDVYLTTNPCNAMTITDTALAAGVSALQDTFSQVSATSAGTAWHVCVTASGDKGDLRLDIPALTLKDQEIATLILTRTAGGVLLNAALLDQQGALTPYSNSIARVRMVADAASGALVSATVNDVSLGADAGSPSVSQYTTVPAGALTATISIGDVALSGITLPAATAGADYTLLVAGSLAAPSVALLQDDNTPSTSASLPVKVRVVNGLNGIVGTVSSTVDSRIVGSNVAFAAASTYTAIAASTGTSTSTVSVTAGSAVQAPLTGQTFSSGGVYTLFVYGDVDTPQVALSADR